MKSVEKEFGKMASRPKAGPGRPLSVAATYRTAVRLPSSTVLKLKAIMKARNWTQSEAIRNAIDHFKA